MLNMFNLLTTFLLFGKNIFRRGAHGKCLACEMFNFEIIYFAEAPAENAPPAKFQISKLYIWRRLIYDIGTKILYFQCFVTTDMFLFCKPIFFSGNCRICRDLAFGSVKTRFKAILKKLDVSAQIDFLQLVGEICRQKGYM